MLLKAGRFYGGRLSILIATSIDVAEEHAKHILHKHANFNWNHPAEQDTLENSLKNIYRTHLYMI